jgi:hypothetical protein
MTQTQKAADMLAAMTPETNSAAENAWRILCRIEGIKAGPMREEYFKTGYRAALSDFKAFLENDTCMYYAAVEIRNRNLGMIESMLKDPFSERTHVKS